jgi:hypothetical protein
MASSFGKCPSFDDGKKSIPTSVTEYCVADTVCLPAIHSRSSTVSHRGFDEDGRGSAGLEKAGTGAGAGDTVP